MKIVLLLVLLVLSTVPASAPASADGATTGSTGSRWASARWAGQHVLGFDPAGTGRVAVVLGDLTTARRIVVVVPGAGISLDTFDDPDRPWSRPYGMALALRARLEITGDADVAVVAWLGYHAPDGVSVGAATGGAARAGAAALRTFLGALPAVPVTLVCHSYGAVVCALALPGAENVEDAVLLASPGARAATAADLGPARIWAATSPHDPIRHVPHLRVGDVGHGTDPTDPAFGAHVLDSGAVTEHDGYLLPGSPTLHAVADVAAGRTQEQRGDDVRS